jgi:hypothetical protein
MLSELKARAWTGARRARLDEAKACQLLAWRTLAGLEPVAARMRPDVAKPLLRAGIEKCLPLLDPPSATLDELFDNELWQERFVAAGIAPERQTAAHRWLLDGEGGDSGDAAANALLALGAVVDALDQAQHAIRGLLWRRIRVLGVVLLLLGAPVSGIVLLVSPPEGADLGAGKPWHASSFYPGFPGSGAKPVKPKEGAFFATNDELNPWWIIDLQAPQLLGSVTIVNRSDCCPDRAVPLVLELSADGKNWREVSRRVDTFRTWKPSFAPSKARYVRLRALRRTLLHFKDVRIHAARDAK